LIERSVSPSGGGGGMMASKSLDMMKTGERLIIVGLFIQLGACPDSFARHTT